MEDPLQLCKVAAENLLDLLVAGIRVGIPDFPPPGRARPARSRPGHFCHPTPCSSIEKCTGSGGGSMRVIFCASAIWFLASKGGRSVHSS